MTLIFRAAAERFHTQLKPGQRMGEWTVDTRESFSRPIAGAPLTYDVRRFEIDRTGQIGSNVWGRPWIRARAGLTAPTPIAPWCSTAEIAALM